MTFGVGWAAVPGKTRSTAPPDLGIYINRFHRIAHGVKPHPGVIRPRSEGTGSEPGARPGLLHHQPVKAGGSGRGDGPGRSGAGDGGPGPFQTGRLLERDGGRGGIRRGLAQVIPAQILTVETQGRTARSAYA